MPTVHLKYGGSTATRTLNCPAWVNVAERAPNIDRTSAAAERGTMLHDIMERIYTTDLADNFQEIVQDLEPADVEAVEQAFAITETLLTKYDVEEIVCEMMLQIPGQEIGGSADMIAIGPQHVLIIDYKFGYQPVIDTDQFKLYAIAGMQTEGIADAFPGRTVISAIVQPAVNETTAIEHEHTQEELNRFHRDLILAVKNAETGTTAGNPGSWCKYCPGAPYCEAKRDQAHRFLDYDPKVATDLASGMALVEQMKEHIKAIEGEVFSALEHGLPVPGWKLVLKQQRRYWRDEQAVWHKLRYHNKVAKELYRDEVLKSPAQVEKGLKKAGVSFEEVLGDLVETKSTGTTIAPASDKREAIEIGVVPDALNAIINK